MLKAILNQRYSALRQRLSIKNICAVCGISFLYLFSLPAYATSDVGSARSDMSLLPVISSLFLVLIVILVLALVMKRFNLGLPGSRAIKVVSALSLGARERIVVVEVNGKQHVLGVTSHQINHLFSLDEPLESLSMSDGGDGQQPMTFQKILENLGKKND